MRRALTGALAGLVVVVAVLWARGDARPRPAPSRLRLVPESAEAPLRRVAIHYAPALDHAAMPVWRQLFAALPADVQVDVAVAAPAHFERFVVGVGPGAHPERFHAVVVGNRITTWSRDRLAALAPDRILTPPRVPTRFADRAGDWNAAIAIGRRLYGEEPLVAPFVFEGGDLAASSTHLFVDANLVRRNLGRADASPAALLAWLERTFAQEIVWLGDEPGEVPRHHVMMYAVPLDDRTVAVGDVRLGARLLAAADPTFPVDEDQEGHARRFDRAAELLAARGFRVVRLPVVILPGAGSYVTYTNALFERRDGRRVVYLPTYRLPALDDDAAARYRELGFEVRPIDVSSIYRMNGSLGCLVNVLARG